MCNHKKIAIHYKYTCFFNGRRQDKSDLLKIFDEIIPEEAGPFRTDILIASII